VRGEDMVSGSVKALGVRQYGYGVDVLRYWVCANDLCPELRMPKDEAVKECAGQVKQLRKNFKSLKQILELRREVPPALGLADLRLECQVVLFNLEVLKRKVRQAMLDMRFGSALECIAFFNAHFLPHFCQNALQHVMAFKDERASQIFNTTSILHDHLARLVYPFLPFNI
jgi:isoleucyl-tRNA synthetase